MSCNRRASIESRRPYTNPDIAKPESTVAAHRSLLCECRLSSTSYNLGEVHGTCTQSGDPVEAVALSANRGSHESLIVGSVESKIGPYEAISGWLASLE